MGMPILLANQIDQIRAVCGDSTLDVLWNRRTETYVVVQKLPGVRRTHPFLVGCPTCPGPMTPYKCMFEMKSKDGYRLEPAPLLIKSLLDTYTIRADSKEFAQMDQWERWDLIQQEQERDRSFEEIIETDGITREVMSDKVLTANRKHVNFGSR